MARSDHAFSAALDAASKRAREAIQRKLVETAYRAHREVLRTDPRPGAFRQYVDGVQGARFERVRWNGNVTIDYSRLDVVAAFAMQLLWSLSPVSSGDYRRAHTLVLNGVPVDNLMGLQLGDEVLITNPLPYARRIEIGKMKMRVPGTDHVYQQAEVIVRRRFSGIAAVRFTYRQPPGAAAATKQAARASRVPALIIAEPGSFRPRRR